MFWPMGINQAAQERPKPFRSKMSLPAEGAVILLGAGASAPVGAPLMRGFIDRARDYLKLELFDAIAIKDIKASIELFDTLRSHFRITEEDIENVENLLSLAELADLIPNLTTTIPSLQKGIASSVRRFIETVLVKAIQLPSPSSPQWQGLHGGPPHKRLVAALEYYREKITIITLNYDCVLEYACYCMGVPFTYNHRYGDGAEILKLHGSINWFLCENVACQEREQPLAVELKYNSLDKGENSVTLEPHIQKCPHCSSFLRPLIVPPTWAKPLENKVLSDTWSRAFEALSNAETFVAIGYSLPIADPKVRELLHVGLASAKLRQAMVVVGQDEDAANRWAKLFRESWREYRLDIRMKNFEEIIDHLLFQALSIPNSAFGDPHLQLLPFSTGPCMSEDTRKRIEAEIKAHSLPLDSTRGINMIDWVNVAREMRQGVSTPHESIKIYRTILSELGLDWRPRGPILPSHGTKLFEKPIAS